MIFRAISSERETMSCSAVLRIIAACCLARASSAETSTRPSSRPRALASSWIRCSCSRAALMISWARCSARAMISLEPWMASKSSLATTPRGRMAGATGSWELPSDLMTFIAMDV